MLDYLFPLIAVRLLGAWLVAVVAFWLNEINRLRPVLVMVLLLGMFSAGYLQVWGILGSWLMSLALLAEVVLMGPAAEPPDVHWSWSPAGLAGWYKATRQKFLLRLLHRGMAAEPTVAAAALSTAPTWLLALMSWNSPWFDRVHWATQGTVLHLVTTVPFLVLVAIGVSSAIRTAEHLDPEGDTDEDDWEFDGDENSYYPVFPRLDIGKAIRRLLGVLGRCLALAAVGAATWFLGFLAARQEWANALLTWWLTHLDFLPSAWQAVTGPPEFFGP